MTARVLEQGTPPQGVLPSPFLWPKRALVLLSVLVSMGAPPATAQKGTEEALQVREELERLAGEQELLEEEVEERLSRLRELEAASQEVAGAAARAAQTAVSQSQEAAERAQEAAEEVAEQAREAAAEAEERWRRHRAGSDDQKFAIGGTVRVREGEVASEVFAFGGRIEIEGEVDGSAVSIMGPVTVNGRVRGDVVSIGNDVRLGPESVVEGSVTSVGGDVEKADGAVVEGEISEAAVGVDLGGIDWFSDRPEFQARQLTSLDEWFSLFWALAMTGCYIILCGLMMIIAPRAVDNVRRTAARDTWKCALLGLAIGLLVVPATVVVVFLLVVSIIGIPFLVLIPFVYLFLFAAGLFGLAGVSVAVGRRLKGRFGLGFGTGLISMVAGLIALRGLSLCGDLFDAIGMPWIIHGMFGVAGFLVWFGACCVALGAVFASRLGQTGPPELPPLPGV